MNESKRTGMSTGVMILIGAVVLVIAAGTIVANLQNARGSKSTRIARARAELKSVVNALESYRLDHSAYPDRFDRLYTGTKYINLNAELPDPLRAAAPDQPYVYASHQGIAYIITSYGPDGDSDVEERLYTGASEQSDLAAWKGASGPLRAFIFDGSNGVKSSGDILEVRARKE